MRVPTSPSSTVTPCSLRVSVEQSPSGINLFPYKQTTHTHIHTCCFYGLCRCCYTQWSIQSPKMHTTQAKKGHGSFSPKKKISILLFCGGKTKLGGGNLSKDLDSCFKRQVRSVFDCSLLELEDLDSARCARTFRAGNYCNLILSEGTTEEKLVLLLSVRVFQGEKQRELEWPCDS